jgi:hypothetical protein
MSFPEIFTLFAAGVTSFGVIVGIFSVYNGRQTRRAIGALIRESQELIAREAEASRQILQGITDILARIDEPIR